MSLQVLILGGSQYLSRNIAKFYIKQNAVVDVLTRGKLRLNYHGIRHQLIADRQDGNTMAAALKNKHYDLVIDCSCYQALDVSNISAFLQNQTGKYILLSSGAVYLSTNQPAAESNSRGLNQDWGHYGLHKLQAEESVIGLGLPHFTIIRPSYIYGKDNNLHREAYFFQRLQLGLDIPVPNNPLPVLNQFIYIDDLISVIAQLANDNASGGEAFNVSHSDNISWLEYVNCCAQIVNVKAKLNLVNYQQLDLKPRQFFPFRDINYQLDCAKLSHYKLPIPQTDLATGLAASYRYLQQNGSFSADPTMNKL